MVQMLINFLFGLVFVRVLVLALAIVIVRSLIPSFFSDVGLCVFSFLFFSFPSFFRLFLFGVLCVTRRALSLEARRVILLD